MNVRKDAGLTLVELLVAMSLLGAASTLMLAGLRDMGSVMNRADDNNRGLADAKVVLDRVARDIRESRGVICDGGLSQLDDPASSDPDCRKHLQLWVDNDSDYAMDQDEVVTWRLAQSSDAEHFDVVRYNGSADTVGRIQATSLIVQTLFSYPGVSTPQDATVVAIEMTYDAMTGQGIDRMTATVSAKLRNKAG